MIVSAETLKRAGEIIREIEALQSELNSLFSESPAARRVAKPVKAGRPPGRPPGRPAGRKRRKMTPEGRAAIAAAAKARWARYHAEQKKA